MWMLEADAQPELFSSIPAGIWWSIVTITTIGYGDMVPVTPAGKLIGGFIAVLGICVFALPVGVLGAGFVEEMNRKKGRQNAMVSPFLTPTASGETPHCPHCGKSLEAHADEG